MKDKKIFDFVIGNPPYQGENQLNTRQPPIYNIFMDAVYPIANVVELITPGRFLFNAGQTPKEWNEKMLNDAHLKVLNYEPDSSKVFSNTDIKGGVVITMRNSNKNYGSIGTFTAFPELNSILLKTNKKFDQGLDTIISPRGTYRTTEQFAKDYKDYISRLGDGTGNMIASNFFEKIPECYKKSKPNDNWIGFVNRIKGQRTICYIEKKYVIDNPFLSTYNVLVPESNGTGAIGEVLSTPLIGEPLIGEPLIGVSDTFISIGKFKSRNEAESCMKYVKTKYARVMLGVLKATQHNPASTWKYVPLQDFTPSSDIDWNKSIHEIDLQLYKKYGLDQHEIDFIETNVKEMN